MACIPVADGKPVGVQPVQSIDGGSFGFGNEMDGDLGRSNGLGPLAGSFRLVLGHVAPDGGNGDDILEGDALDDTSSQLLAQRVHEMAGQGRDVVGQELVNSVVAAGDGTFDAERHVLEGGIQITTKGQRGRE